MMDDFMDQDLIRRGGQTTHKFYESKPNGNAHYGESMAVNIGGVILNLGYELLLDSGSTAAMHQMLRGIANTFYGQSYDVTLEREKVWTEEDVLSLHRAKTGLYTYENPLVIGALLAEQNSEVIQLLKSYSADGGVAFQLQDDILGVFGSAEKTGKSADSDLMQGKCTLLVLKAFESKTHKPVVQKVWGDPNATRADLDAAKQAIIDSGSLDYSRELAKKLAANAAITANKLRKLNLTNEAVDFIQGIAEYMVIREV
jgi:geranylgeranyl diphosphate synthase type I